MQTPNQSSSKLNTTLAAAAAPALDPVRPAYDRCRAAQAGQQLFRADAFAFDITPTNLSVIINGGFLAASAAKVTDPLHARCLVLDDGETRVGLCVIDSCLIPRELADEAKRLIAQATGLQEPID